MATKAKHLPERTCVGCRKIFPQSALRRFVHTSAGWVGDEPGNRRKHPGRGAYLCSAACAARAAKNRRYPGLASDAEKYGLISSS